MYRFNIAIDYHNIIKLIGHVHIITELELDIPLCTHYFHEIGKVNFLAIKNLNFWGHAK